jgi:hypothetical protein
MGLQYRIRGGESIIGNVFSAVVTDIIGIFRIRYDDGTEDDWSIDRFTTGSARGRQLFYTNRVARGSGWVVDGFVGFINGTPGRGQTYVIAFINGAASGPVANPIAVVAADYVYPGNPVQVGVVRPAGPSGGRGTLKTVTGTNPAAGVEISEAVPTNTIWQVLSFTAVLVSSGVAGNRAPVLIIDDGTTANRRNVIRDSTSVQAASLTRTWTWVRGFDLSSTAEYSQADTDTLIVVQKLPTREDVELLQSARIRTVTSAFDVGDDWAAPIFQVQEWVVPLV